MSIEQTVAELASEIRQLRKEIRKSRATEDMLRGLYCEALGLAADLAEAEGAGEVVLASLRRAGDRCG